MLAFKRENLKKYIVIYFSILFIVTIVFGIMSLHQKKLSNNGNVLITLIQKVQSNTEEIADNHNINNPRSINDLEITLHVINNTNKSFKVDSTSFLLSKDTDQYLPSGTTFNGKAVYGSYTFNPGDDIYVQLYYNPFAPTLPAVMTFPGVSALKSMHLTIQ